MKTPKLLILVIAIVLACEVLHADPVIQKFEFWGAGSRTDKIYIYAGWTNGFLLARGSKAEGLLVCLEGMTNPQAVAMIDKHYKDHPELWSHVLGEEILAALTVEGGPCEGKNPLTASR